MSEVHRYLAVKMQTDAGNNISYTPHGPEIVLAEHFDRVTAERDAALGREAQSNIKRAKSNLVVCAQYAKIEELQQRLTESHQREARLQDMVTAADERSDVLEAALALLIKVTPRNKSSFADKRRAMEILAALNPAEGGDDA